ncbi:MAG: hypothetical protein PsegKO_25090 [Pseudohongiellaceae bacterium]
MKSNNISERLATIAIQNFPLWQELIDEIRQGDGGLCFPQSYESVLGGKECLNWASYYLDKKSFERAYLKQNLRALESQDFSKMPSEFWQLLTAKLCDFPCLMSFGQSIFYLVLKAQDNNDKALCQVVQIDKTTLYAIPHFNQRLARAQLTSDRVFMSKLATAVKSPSLGSKIKYPMLLLFFAMLDDVGILEMPLDDLLDLCERVGIYGAAHGVEDRDSLRKRRTYYIKRNGRQSLT